ncbi:MAG TPA: HAMP domain-containing sensor histidine kinase, partial [Candidatus Saccharibacteria bacterium]|nr:HAMP domain-containing sensor histidine kinase [Candidatus Saccharibacteria bacterium]
IVNLLTQIVAFALATQVFIHYFRKKQASKTENLKKEEDLVKMQTLDNTRNEFMENSALTIDRGVRQYDDSAKQVEDKDKLKMAQKGVDNLKDIGNKFTTIAALQKGEIEANKEPLNISQIISQILQKHQQKISDKVLKINSELEDITFNTDKEKLTFILDTVIDNAIKFSKKNGLVKIQLKISTDKAQIIVEDNGIGMSEQAQKILFKPFSRGTSTLTFDYEGMGTNLYVAKLMCSYLDANIEFESQKDKGAKVKITINN